MDGIVFRGFGIDILKREGRFFVEYDAGEISDKIVQAEITEAEARKAQRTEQDAYEVILGAQQRLPSDGGCG